MNKYLQLTLIAGGVFLLDQGTKLYIQSIMRLHESIVIIRGFFSLTYIQNPGAAFGFLADQSDGFRTYFFLGVSFVALNLLAAFFVKTPGTDRIALSAISLLFGGALGNLVDRVRVGEVIDFLDFYVGRYHWPAFNVADSAITVGITLLLLDLFLKRRSAYYEEGV